MAMVKGTVAIDALTGQVTASTGLAKRIFDGLNARADYQGLAPGPALAVAKKQIADLAEVIADAVIGEIVENASVATTVTVTSVSGVTAGVGTSGPGSGSGSGRVT